MSIEQNDRQYDAGNLPAFSHAVELGKWPDGVALTAEQKENCTAAGDAVAVSLQR